MFVIFMTDGHDTCNSPASIMASKEKLQDIMAKYGEEVIVHVLGFSEQHNDAFLKELSLLVSFHYFFFSSENPLNDGIFLFLGSINFFSYFQFEIYKSCFQKYSCLKLIPKRVGLRL